MDSREIFKRIDHTLLKPDATLREIEVLCEEASRYGAASVCIPPCYVSRVYNKYSYLPITTVIGFPCGYSVAGTKVFEAEQALQVGATEIDMVVNIGDVKNKAFHRIMAEITAVKRVADEHILKVIIESGYLDEKEKIELCSILGASGADYLKTCTGFASKGAELEDMQLFRQYLPNHVKIKAAGGICSKQTMEDFLNAGASRLGCSSGVKILFGENK